MTRYWICDGTGESVFGDSLFTEKQAQKEIEKNRLYQLRVFFSHEDIFTYGDKIEASVGQRSGAAGFDFINGERDIAFFFQTEDELRAAETKVRRFRAITDIQTTEPHLVEESYDECDEHE